MSYPYLIQPRPEQLRAQRRTFRTKRQLILGDMGTGKTKIGVDFIGNLFYHGKIQRALVIMPQTALGVWELSLEQNCPFLTYDTIEKKKKNINWNANVLMVNYEYFRPRRKAKRSKRDGSILRRKDGSPRKKIDHSLVNTLLLWEPQVVVVDEGHKFKNPSSRTAQAIHKIGEVCEYALDLTGTPTGNKKALDYWSHFKFLKPGLLDSKFNEFKKKYAIYGGFGGFKLVGYRNLDELSNILRPYITRIKKTGLPPKNFIPYPVIMPESAKKLYKQMEKEFLIEIEKTEISAPLAISKAIKLQEIAGGFIKDNDGKEIKIHDVKIEALRDILEELREQGETRVVIFARFKWELARIQELLEQENWPYHRVSGRIPREVEDRYNTEGLAMVCQTASGSVSNNFQAGNYLIFYSADRSLINFLQAVDRIHRLGQTKPCFYYLLRSKGTIDSLIYRNHQEGRTETELLYSMVEEIRSHVNS